MHTLAERTSRLLMLIMLPEFKPTSATNVMQAFSDKLLGITTSVRQSLTYDQEQEQLEAIADQINNWPRKGLAHDHPWRSIERSCSTARNTRLFFNENQGVSHYF